MIRQPLPILTADLQQILVYGPYTKICCKSAVNTRGELLGQMREINQFFISISYLFFGDLRTGQTARRMFMIDGSNDADSSKSVLLRVSGFVYIASHLGGQISPELHFWGMHE